MPLATRQGKLQPTHRPHSPSPQGMDRVECGAQWAAVAPADSQRHWSAACWRASRAHGCLAGGIYGGKYSDAEFSPYLWKQIFSQLWGESICTAL